MTFIWIPFFKPHDYKKDKSDRIIKHKQSKRNHHIRRNHMKFCSMPPLYIHVLIIASVLIMTIAVLVVYLSDLGYPVGNSDEAIYAEFIRSMQQTGDYFQLRYDGHVTLQRPPQTIAFYALISQVVSGEAGLRLGPALLTALTCLLTAFGVWTTYRCAGGALVTFFLLAGTPSVYVYGRLISSDPPFLLACTAALIATMAAQRRPRWFLWALIALGATFCTKSFAGSVALVALGPWLLAAFWRHRSTVDLRPWLSLGGFLVTATPYFIVSTIVYGQTFLEEHVGFNLLARASGEIVRPDQPGPWFYFRHLWLVDGSTTAALLLGSITLAALLAFRDRDPSLGVAATYSFLTLVVLSALGWRTGHYLLPFYPGSALCLGLLVSKYTQRLVDSTRGIGGKKETTEENEPSVNMSDKDVRTTSEREGEVGKHITDSAAFKVREIFFRVIAPLLAFMLLLSNLSDPFAEPHLRPSPDTVALSKTVRHITAPGERIYSLDWYAPALGYYAKRSWGMLTTSKRAATIVGQVHVFKNAGTVVTGPPWPRGRLIIALPRATLNQPELPGFHDVKILDLSGPLALIEAHSR